MIPRLEHVGIAVRDAEIVARVYEILVGAGPYKSETVVREGVSTHFISSGGPKLELLSSLAASSPIARFLDRRGEGLHHVAFEVADVHASLRNVRQAGFTPLTDQPVAGADGKLVFFVHPKDTHGVLIELCQSVAREVPFVALPFATGFVAGYRWGAPVNPVGLIVQPPGTAVDAPVAALAGRLEPFLQIVALDPPGAGNSLIDADDLSQPGIFFDALIAVLDAFDVNQVVPVGLGSGCSRAMQITDAAPERCKALILLDPAEDRLCDETYWANSSLPTLIVGQDEAPSFASGTMSRLKSRRDNVSVAVLPGKTGKRSGEWMDLQAPVVATFIRVNT